MLTVVGWLLSSYAPLKHNTIEQPEPTQLTKIFNKEFVKVLDIQVVPHTFYKNIDFNFPYSSFIFEVGRDENFVGTMYFTTENESFSLDSIPQTDQAGDERRSPFIIPNNAQSTFSFYSGELAGQVRLFLFYAAPINVTINAKLGKKAGSFCEKPEIVNDDVWRKGLPNPTGSRQKHTVNHCIVHHAASSNTNSDYVNVIRNIYLLHTQTNGWDDIGYNFIVAQDGSIFEGRANQDIDSSDNILGAHFCGKNTNTMGICLLGNYQEIRPTDKSIQALTHLLTWKCYKDQIDPFGKTPHPNASSSDLNHIAGHQDGCATACPGDSVYRLLSSIKISIDSVLTLCRQISATPDYAKPKSFGWYQSTYDQRIVLTLPHTFTAKSITIRAITGQSIRIVSFAEIDNHIILQDINPGVYICSVEGRDGQIISEKILVN